MTLNSATQTRDHILRGWLKIASPQEKVLTAWYFMDGSHAEKMPIALRRAQERLLEELNDSEKYS